MARSKQSKTGQAITSKTEQAAATGRAVRPRRPARPRLGTQATELSLTTLRAAVLEFVRLAVEHEQLFQPITGPDASDRRARQAIQKATNADATLADIVRTINSYQEDRRQLVAQVRAAQVAGEIVEFVKKRREEWRVEQRERRRERLPSTDISGSSRFRREVEEYIKKRLEYWEIEAKPSTISRATEVATVRAPGGKGLQVRVLEVIAQVTTAKARTLEGYLSALSGSEQRQGRIRDPAHVQNMLFEEPVGGSEILEYVLRALVARGHPRHIVPKIMRTWKDELDASFSAGAVLLPGTAGDEETSREG